MKTRTTNKSKMKKRVSLDETDDEKVEEFKNNEPLG